jgi:hypothetical protein
MDPAKMSFQGQVQAGRIFAYKFMAKPFYFIITYRTSIYLVEDHMF